MEMLEALRVVDEPENTPAGARSIEDLRYELTTIGPRSADLGAAIDSMISNPGDGAWKPYADAVVKNPGTVLSPGFAYARRPIDPQPGRPDIYWDAVRDELKAFDATGLHLAVLGPILNAKLGAITNAPGSVERNGLSLRPTVMHLPGQSSSYR